MSVIQLSLSEDAEDEIIFNNFLKDYKVTGCEKANSVAFELASELSSEPEFKDSKRVRYKKRQLQY